MAHVISDPGSITVPGPRLKVSAAVDQALTLGNLHFDLHAPCTPHQLDNELLVCLQGNGALSPREQALFEAFLTQPGTVHSTTPATAAIATRLLQQSRINGSVQIDSATDCPSDCSPRALRITRP